MYYVVFCVQMRAGFFKKLKHYDLIDTERKTLLNLNIFLKKLKIIQYFHIHNTATDGNIVSFILKKKWYIETLCCSRPGKCVPMADTKPVTSHMGMRLWNLIRVLWTVISTFNLLTGWGSHIKCQLLVSRCWPLHLQQACGMEPVRPDTIEECHQHQHRLTLIHIYNIIIGNIYIYVESAKLAWLHMVFMFIFQIFGKIRNDRPFDKRVATNCRKETFQRDILKCVKENGCVAVSFFFFRSGAGCFL